MPHLGAARTIAKASVRGRQALPHNETLPHLVPQQAVAGSEEVGPQHTSASCAPCAQTDEGLLHDVRNLVSAVSLYCDLLSMPHVLRPEHRHYADELRLLGERSAALIQRLIEAAARSDNGLASPFACSRERRTSQPETLVEKEQPHFEGLRPMVERCAGLLHGVASGRPIEIVYGDAAVLPVRVAAEPVERILINLVRNASSALAEAEGCIRIGVGMLHGPEGEIRPWPFQRVRLFVEDDGCGMSAGEIEGLLRGGMRESHHHGIGFRVVRELVAASGGELFVASEPGEGTRVEIAWPVATPAIAKADESSTCISLGERRRPGCQN